MVTIGEVHTGLLQHSTALSPGQCISLLSLREGEPVMRSERPGPYAASPQVLTGVDCRLPSQSGRQVRAAGTVATRTLITGGRILQGSSHTTVTRGKQRHLWSHYLAQPGRMETVGNIDFGDFRTGFINGRTADDTLDIEAVSGRAMDTVQQSEVLDRRAPIRTPRTCVRWIVAPADRPTSPRVTFRVQTDTIRTLELFVDDLNLSSAIALCEDLALHDWLLTTLSALLSQTMSSPNSATEKVARLRPVIEHLMHLWMPGARVPDDVLSVWEDIDKRPGFTRQWNASVDWIRDQVSIGTMALLQAGLPDPVAQRFIRT